MVVSIDSGGLKLRGHLSRPSDSAGTEVGRLGLVLCHGFPSGPRGALTSAETYPELADKLATEAGWVVLTFKFRGCGESEGEFSLEGWLADLRAAIAYLYDVEGVAGVWLAGFSAGGALAICAAGEDERIGGVAALAAPSDFGDWASDPRRFLAYAREVGVVRTNDFPPDFDAWTRELREIRPAELVGKIPPRPLLIVQGTDDDVVPQSEARLLADAAGGQAELRTISGAGHRLRHDPRAVAVLLGWLDRQHL